jgi:hypothetical protein
MHIAQFFELHAASDVPCHLTIKEAAEQFYDEETYWQTIIKEILICDLRKKEVSCFS